MKRHFLSYFILCSLIALGANACDKDDDSSSDSGKNNPGQEKTDNNNENQNNNNENQNNNNHNTSPETNAIVTLDDFTESTDEPCDGASEEYCEDEKAYFCNEDGKYAIRDCAAYSKSSGISLSCKKMDDGNIVDCVSACNPGAFETYRACNGKDVEIHSCEPVDGGGNYEFIFTEKTCSQFCYDGQCTAEQHNIPVEGNSCDASFVAQCYDNSIFTCDQNIIRRNACSNGAVCATERGASAPSCAIPCRGTSDDVYSCTDDPAHPAAVNQYCSIATNGNMYLFTHTQDCKSKCNAGLCDRTVPNEGDPCSLNDFDDLCYQNVLYYCHSEKNTIEAEPCSGSFCRYLADGYNYDNYAECVTPCEEGTDLSELSSCVGKAERAYETYYECYQSTDGSFYSFMFQNRCTNECENNRCKQ